ncbi:GAF domain-containing protein [Persicimonas caeni]|uniref:histidine kinase n=1 Tax=Persicimonas caeni TaxID=2292766 RepID=A0A4Y6PQM7_PERCE|nr:AAA family ATPase [Persicimonas caeni]QDG50641.1 GAF domain-containing protein [Persicimonas caeni]QED31862.1 AAA family ATPase [Persicimonas caeni]
MTGQIRDYDLLAKLYGSARTVVYRARKVDGGPTYILKVLSESHPTPRALVRYRHEFDITRALDGDGIIEVYGLEKHLRGLVMVLEDIGGESLAQTLRRRQFELEEFLEVAIAVTEALGQVHAQGVIHKDINPANIVWNETTGQVKLIDFGIATSLAREWPSGDDPNESHGTLAYMSPEQTGRTSRPLDYRTDFYSLGATFYEMLTGQRPCDGEDELAVFHCHLAQVPRPPHELRLAVPRAVSDIVLRLLAKPAEERYQSAHGLRCDLQRCLDALRARGAVEPFELGEHDVRATLQVSQKLYGRSGELARLLEALEDAAAGARKLVLLTGPGGVGKSALVRETQTAMLGRRVRLAASKFDQNKRDVPHSGCAQALEALISQILGLPADEVERWRARAEEALESNGALLAEIAPDIEALLGPQPELPPMTPEEARHRLGRAVSRFLALFAEPERPLTLFFDDLQWADAASLELIATLLGHDELDHLLIIGAYRAAEIAPTHPLQATLLQLEERTVEVESIPVEPLSCEHVQALVADTLQAEPAAVDTLARLIHEKTSGNPYFVNRFIEDLYARDLLWFDARAGKWCWSDEAIEQAALTDNVVELLIERLRTLPEPTCEALQMAALLGRQFHLGELADACDSSDEALYKDLLPAVESGIVRTNSRPELSDVSDDEAPLVVRRLGFPHDRVQEAAAQLLSAEDRPQAELKVGRILHERMRQEEGEALLFDVVGHLDAARQIIDEETERLDLARLNVRAARRAMGSLAFTAASHYLEAAHELLPDAIWQVDAPLAMDVLRLRGETESQLGHFELAEELLERALEHTDDPVERAKLHTLLVRQYANRAQLAEALDTVVECLTELGVDFPVDELDIAMGDQFSRVQARLGGESIATLTERPHIDHPAYEAALHILGAFHPAAGILDQRLLLLDGLKAIELSLEIGVRPETVLGLAVYGLVLVRYGRFEEAYQAGALSLELAARFDEEFLAAHAGMLQGGMVAHWARPLDESIAVLVRAQRDGLRSGNLQFAGFAAVHRVYQQFCRGKNLVDLAEQIESALELAERTNNTIALDQVTTTRRLTRHLRGETDDDDFVEGRTDEWAADLLERYRSRDNDAVVTSMAGARGILHLHYGRPHKALDDLERVQSNLTALLDTIDVSRDTFYVAMAHAACAQGASAGQGQKDKRQEHLESLVELRERIAFWCEACRENFEHQLELVDAEIAWLHGELFDALDHFDHAVELARQRGFTEMEALAYERAAELWLSRDKARFARTYIKEAIYAYRLWGATRKVEWLEARHAELLASVEADLADSPSGSGGAELDITSVFRASESIARRIEVDELLTTLMQVTAANAGAQRGAFFLVEPRGVLLAVEGEAGAKPRLVAPPQKLGHWKGGARSVVRYVARTGEPVVLARATDDERFQNDRYVREHQLRSVLCMPVEEAGELRGVLYLENNLSDAAFTENRLRVLNILAGHIAVSLSKAQLYETVHEEKERFRQLAENIHEVLWLMDWPSRQIVYVSPAYSHTWGRPLPNLPIGLDRWVEAVVPDDRDHVRDALDHKLDVGDYDIIYEIERPSGARRWIRERGFPIRREDGQTIRIAGIAEDITRQHEVEKMKDEFISIVSHELRTPLTPIKGIFEILGRDEKFAGDVATERMIELGLRNSNRLLKLIDDLLDIQKLSLSTIHFDNELVDVAAVVSEALQINEPLGDSKNIDFVLDVDEPHLEVHADRERLMQVFTNLLSNAVKFSEPSQRVEMHIARVDDHARVSVTDHGTGIPEEAQERVFQKFVQADSSMTRKHGGTGLGLAISQAIVERLGGRIYFESEVDEGTTFFVELPLVG